MKCCASIGPSPVGCGDRVANAPAASQIYMAQGWYILEEPRSIGERTKTSAGATFAADEDAILAYPEAFDGGSTGIRGAYTVVWEIDGGFVACDGFVTIGGASW